MVRGQQPENLPALVAPGEKSIVQSTFIYPPDAKPTPECHASTLVELKNGILAAAWFGGTYERHADVGIWLSFRKNGKWSKPVEVINGFQNDSLRYPCWNPVLFKSSKGPLMLFYKVGPNPREWWGMVMTSDDEGKSWSYPRKLGDDPRIGHLIGPVKNKPVELKNGLLLCPSSTETNVGKEDFWKVHFEMTKDFGKTWEVIGPVNDGVDFDAIQPSILFYKGGRLQALCRSRQGVITTCWSDDNGMTWGRMLPTELPNPNSGTDAVTLRDGRQLLIYNHSTRNGDFPAGRNILNLAISVDGVKWKPVMTLEKQAGEYSYPAIIRSKDGKVHITYTYQRKTIKYVEIDPNYLK